MNSLKEYPAYISVRILVAVFSYLPIRAVLFIGKLAGTAQFYLDKKHKDTAYKNLRIAFAKDKSPLELKKILKKNFQGFAQNFAELLCLKRINKEYIAKYVQIEGRQNIDEAFKIGKGVIFSGVHEGNWELSNATLGLLGYNFSIIAEVQRNRLLNSLLDSYRQDKGYGVISVNAILRSMVKSLKENSAVGVVIDHGGMDDGILVEFFNRLAYTPTGAIKLAMKYGAALLLGYVYRQDGPRHKLVILPPFELIDTGNLEKDLYTNLKKINAVIEDFIRQHPEEYLWSYKRWKKSPQKSIIILNNGNSQYSKKCREKLAEVIEKHKDCVADVKELSPNQDLTRIYADIIISPSSLELSAKKLAHENQAEVYLV